MKILGKEFDINDIMIIGQYITPKLLEQDRSIYVSRCFVCFVPLTIEDQSISLLDKGAFLSCFRCALENWPDLVAGIDPDTGQPMTMRDLANRPNPIGAYDRKDITDE